MSTVTEKTVSPIKNLIAKIPAKKVAIAVAGVATLVVSVVVVEKLRGESLLETATETVNPTK